MKIKVLPLIFAVIFMISAFSLNVFAEEQEETPEITFYGDANSDGEVDNSDLIRLKRYLAGRGVELNFLMADVNIDGKIDNADLIRLKKYLAGQSVLLGSDISHVHDPLGPDEPPVGPDTPPEPPTPPEDPEPVLTALRTRYAHYLGFRGGYAIGIDISTFQGDIDWEKAKAHGVEFAIIRIGFRGYGYDTPNIVFDKRFEANIKGAAEVGIPVGIYFYSTAINEEEATAEAEWVIANLKDYDIDYPIAYDFEERGKAADHRGHDITREQLSKDADAFLTTVKNAGYGALIYGSKSGLKDNFESWVVDKWPVWMANYTNEIDTTYEGDFVMWQLASDGVIDGIPEYVDIDIAYFKYPLVMPEDPDEQNPDHR